MNGNTSEFGLARPITVLSTDENKNYPPNAYEDEATVDEDSAIEINVLANDTDPNGDSLTVTGIRQTQDEHSGQITINPDNTIHYVPAPNSYRGEGFQYRISDNRGSDDGFGQVVVKVNPT